MAASYQPTTTADARPSNNGVNTPRYIPDDIPISQPTTRLLNDDFITRSGQLPPSQTQTQPEPAAFQPAAFQPAAFQPAAPEQYRQSKYSRNTPPAQLPLNYPSMAAIDSDGYGRRPTTHRRHLSTDSRTSARSQASSRSHQSHAYSHREHDSTQEHHREHHSHHNASRDHDHDYRRHSSDQDSTYDAPLKRKNTHRPGFGGTLFSLGSYIKSALKGE